MRVGTQIFPVPSPECMCGMNQTHGLHKTLPQTKAKGLLCSKCKWVVSVSSFWRSLKQDSSVKHLETAFPALIQGHDKQPQLNTLPFFFFLKINDVYFNWSAACSLACLYWLMAWTSLFHRIHPTTPHNQQSQKGSAVLWGQCQNKQRHLGPPVGEI